jgi:hypothetical protein
MLVYRRVIFPSKTTGSILEGKLMFKKVEPDQITQLFADERLGGFPASPTWRIIPRYHPLIIHCYIRVCPRDPSGTKTITRIAKE